MKMNNELNKNLLMKVFAEIDNLFNVGLIILFLSILIMT
jgi:hypothetical protein